jgi:hypothetical protein
MIVHCLRIIFFDSKEKQRVASSKVANSYVQDGQMSVP